VEKSFRRACNLYDVIRRLRIELNIDSISLLHQHGFYAAFEVVEVFVYALQSFKTGIERVKKIVGHVAGLVARRMVDMPTL
jgi:hypothetical protein